MSGTTYYWQGGRKIEIEQAGNLATVQADSVEEVEKAAERAGVRVRRPQMVSRGVVRLEVPDDRDGDMERLRATHVVHHVYHTKGQPDDELLITDTLFIKFKEGTSRQEIDAYFRAEHLEVEDVFGDLSFLVRVTDGTGKNPLKTANLAASMNIVEYAEPNLVRKLSRFSFIPTDPLFPKQWHLHAPANGVDLTAGADIKAPDAWDNARGTRDVVIAVADDGFDLTHPDFPPDKIAGRLNVRAHPNGVDLSYDEDVLPQAGDYHGTPCAGVALAEHNGSGTVGVAPGCAFYAVRFPLNMSDAQLSRMFERISEHADVVSCSWGVGPANAPMATTLRDTITHLAAAGGRRGKGLVFCVAAGNNNCPIKDLNNTTPYQFLSQSGTVRTYSGPIDRWIAAHSDVITVSASTSLKTRAAYSSWGVEINVCAPSNNFDDLQRFRPRGRGIWTTDNEGFGANSDFTPGSRFTGDFGGTSSATPTVAGVCGLVISRNGSLTGKQVREIIEKTASKDLVIASETPVNVPGNFDGNGFSPWFGYGRVDAAAAVQRAAENAGQLARVEQAAQDVPIDIPDAGSPITSRIKITDRGQIEEMRIHVALTHSYIGDLRIDLIAPDGVAATLYNQEGGSQRNLDRIFTSADVPALRAMTGKSVTGEWVLRIVDLWFWDQGRLDSWTFMARLSGAEPMAVRPRGRTRTGSRAQKR